MRKNFSLIALGCMLSGTAMAMPQKMEQQDLLNPENRHAEMIINRNGKEMTVRHLNAPAREMEITPIILDVEGREQTMSKSSAGLYLYGGLMISSYEMTDGLATVVYGDNNDIYFYNILSNGVTNTYVKGEIDGNIINMSLPQTVYFYESYGFGYNLAVIKYEEWEEDGNMFVGGEYCEDITNVTFTIEEDGTISLNLPGEPGEYVLGYVWTDDSTWSYYGDFYQNYTPVEIDLYSMPEGVATETYLAIKDGLGYPVEVAVDGDYLYFKGLCQELPDGVVRADYDAATGIASIPQDQNVGIAGSYLIITKVIFDDLVSEFVLGPETMTYDLVVDLENKVIESKYYEGFDSQPYLCFNAAPDRVFYLEYMRDIIMQVQSSYAGTPTDAYNLYTDDIYFPYTGFIYFYFDATEVSTERKLLDVDHLYYQVFIDDELMEFEYDPENEPLPAYDGLNEPTTQIPYTLSNGWDIVASGITHNIALYFEGFDTLGIRMVYHYQGVTTYSNVVTLNINTGQITTGVNNIDSQDIINIEYYDLQGRRISNPDNGIFVKRMTLNDGTVITRKVARR